MWDIIIIVGEGGLCWACLPACTPFLPTLIHSGGCSGCPPASPCLPTYLQADAGHQYISVCTIRRRNIVQTACVIPPLPCRRMHVTNRIQFALRPGRLLPPHPVSPPFMQADACDQQDPVYAVGRRHRGGCAGDIRGAEKVRVCGAALGSTVAEAVPSRAKSCMPLVSPPGITGADAVPTWAEPCTPFLSPHLFSSRQALSLSLFPSFLLRPLALLIPAHMFFPHSRDLRLPGCEYPALLTYTPFLYVVPQDAMPLVQAAVHFQYHPPGVTFGLRLSPQLLPHALCVPAACRLLYTFDSISLELLGLRLSLPFLPRGRVGGWTQTLVADSRHRLMVNSLGDTLLFERAKEQEEEEEKESM